MHVDGRLRLGSERARPHRAAPRAGRETSHDEPATAAEESVHDEVVAPRRARAAEHAADQHMSLLKQTAQKLKGRVPEEAEAEGEGEEEEGEAEAEDEEQPDVKEVKKAAKTVYDAFNDRHRKFTAGLPLCDPSNPAPVPLMGPVGGFMGPTGLWMPSDPCVAQRGAWNMAKDMATHAVQGAVEGAMNYQGDGPPVAPTPLVDDTASQALEARLKHAAKAEYDALWGPLPPWAMYAAMQPGGGGPATPGSAAVAGGIAQAAAAPAAVAAPAAPVVAAPAAAAPAAPR